MFGFFCFVAARSLICSPRASLVAPPVGGFHLFHFPLFSLYFSFWPPNIKTFALHYLTRFGCLKIFSLFLFGLVFHRFVLIEQAKIKKKKKRRNLCEYGKINRYIKEISVVQMAVESTLKSRSSNQYYYGIT